MKYLITESQMDSFFDDYIKRIKPELFNLSKFPMRRRDKSVYGYEFEIGDSLILVFEYFITPESKNEVCVSCPKLRISSRKLRDELEGMFGHQGLELLAKWFEKQYELPVKTYFK